MGLSFLRRIKQHVTTTAITSAAAASAEPVHTNQPEADGPPAVTQTVGVTAVLISGELVVRESITFNTHSLLV